MAFVYFFSPPLSWSLPWFRCSAGDSTGLLGKPSPCPPLYPYRPPFFLCSNTSVFFQKLPAPPLIKPFSPTSNSSVRPKARPLSIMHRFLIPALTCLGSLFWAPAGLKDCTCSLNAAVHIWSQPACQSGPTGRLHPVFQCRRLCARWLFQPYREGSSAPPLWDLVSFLLLFLCFALSRD